MLQLHQEHADGSPEIGADDQHELIAALEQQIAQLERERETIIQQSPAHANVYHEFYRRPKKKIDHELAAFKEQARQRTEFARECVREIKTLKALRPVLEQRRDEHILGFRYSLSIDDPL